MGYIYCIRNKITGKCYIGETIRECVEERWNQHIKMINKGKGCPALRDAINKHGLDNFEFKILLICFDKDVHKYEKEYIAKYKSQVPTGYNILPGGVGGAGFKGKRHTPESIAKSKEGVRRFREQNPDWYERCREKHAESMAKVDIGAAVKSSEKWQKAKAEGRVGASAHKDGGPSEETKDKIRESVLKYFEENGGGECNIEKHRTAMAASVGVKVEQYDKLNKLLATFNSISEASRHSGIPKSTIGKYLKCGTSDQSEFIWKKTT